MLLAKLITLFVLFVVLHFLVKEYLHLLKGVGNYSEEKASCYPRVVKAFKYAQPLAIIYLSYIIVHGIIDILAMI